MSLQRQLRQNRDRMSVPDPSQIPIAQIPPERIAAILTSTIALIDAVDHLNPRSLAVEVGAVKQLADAVEQAIAQAVLEAR